MSDFINTVDVIGDEALTNSIIDRSIVEYNDDTIMRIGYYAFYKCSSLTTISFPAATAISYSAFAYCSSLREANFPAVTNIATSAFAYCSSLTEANFPMATGLGTAAFIKCASLTTINFPEVLEVNNTVFGDCSSLKEANFPVAKYIRDYAFQNCSSLTTISFPVAITTGYAAFQSCSSLREANFPAVTLIGDRTFEGCLSLTTISFPMATRISYGAFSSCRLITEANFPEVTDIRGRAFWDCSSLREANFPAVTNIAENAFYSCRSLTRLTLANSQVTTLDTSDVFHNTPMSGTRGSIYVPASLVTAYKTAVNWSYYADRITAMVGIGSADKMTLLFNTTSNVSIVWVGPTDRPEVVPKNISVVSSDTTVATVSGVNTTASDITFNVNSLAKDGATTITVIATIDDNEYSTSFDVRVRETIPQNSYTVEAVPNAANGFALNAAGYYESQNKGKDGSYAICKVLLTVGETTNVYVDCINSGEANYDYGLLSTLDHTLASSNSADSSNVHKNFYGQSSSTIQTVTYENVPEGEHFIYCKFIKDGSQAQGNDSLQFKVRFE